METNVFKYMIDAALFVTVCATGVVGVMLGYLMPGGDAAGAREFFLGLHRNDWADIHLFLSMVLLIIIALHLLANIGWIIRSTRQYFGTFWLKFLGLLAGGWIVVLFIGWFAVKS